MAKNTGLSKGRVTIYDEHTQEKTGKVRTCVSVPVREKS